MTSSTDSTDWSTPQDLFDALDAEFRFTLDPCATPENAKCQTYFTVDEDGLAQDWGGWGSRVFITLPAGARSDDGWRMPTPSAVAVPLSCAWSRAPTLNGGSATSRLVVK